MRGLDYSSDRIPGRTIKAAGYDFVIRYVDDPERTLTAKHIRPDEYQDLIGAGVQVYLVIERQTTDALGGFSRGVELARAARAGAAWIGYPPDGLIFFCSDMHLTASQIPVGLSFLDGAASVMGRQSTGAYGFWEFLDAAIPLGKAAAYWQAGIRPAPNDPKHVWQRNDRQTRVGGVECDINELLRPLPVPGSVQWADVESGLPELREGDGRPPYVDVPTAPLPKLPPPGVPVQDHSRPKSFMERLFPCLGKRVRGA